MRSLRARLRPAARPWTTRGRSPTGPPTAATPAACATRRSRRSRARTSGGSRSPGTITAATSRTARTATTRTSFNVDAARRRGHALLLHRAEPRVRARPRDRRRALELRSEAAPRASSTGPTRACAAASRIGGIRRRCAAAACAQRIFTGTLDAELIALDARDAARPARTSATDGRVALREGIGDAPSPGEYYVTSPPLVIGDVVVVGALVADNQRPTRRAASCARSTRAAARCAGRWDPVPPGWPPADWKQGAERYRRGTPNVWSILSGDAERGLVFVPTGNAAPDYFGGEPPRPRLLLELGGRARRADTGAVALALPDRPPRPLGLRRARAAGALRARRRRRARRAGASRRPPRWVTSSCSTARPASRSSRSRSGPCRRATCRARRSRRRSPSRRTRRRCTRASSRPTTPGASRRGTARQVPREDREHALRRHLHAAERSRARSQFPGTAGGPNWGGVVDRSEHAACSCVNQMRVAMQVQLDAARRVRHARPEAVRVSERAARTDARHAVRGRRACRCSRRSARPAIRRRGARSRRSTSTSGKIALGVAARHHARPGAVPDLAAARRAEPRRLDRRPRAALVFIGATTDKFLRALRRRDRQGDLERSACPSPPTRRR